MPSNEFEVIVNGDLKFVLLDSKMDALLQYLDSIGQGKGSIKKAKKAEKSK